MLIPDDRDDDKNNAVAYDNDDNDNHDHDECDVDLVDDKSQLRECNWSEVITLGRGVEVH